MNYQTLKYHFIPTKTDSENAYTFLLLHGTGGNEMDLIPLAKDLGFEFNLLGVRGNVLENGMPRFFKRIGMGVFDEKDLAFRTHELVSFLKAIAADLKINPDKLIALGYSNGANIAGSTLVLYPDFLAGAILLRPMQPFNVLESFQSKKNIPLLMTSGAIDPTVSVEHSQNWAETLKANNFKVTSHILQTGHHLTEQDIRLIKDWLKDEFKN